MAAVTTVIPTYNRLPYLRRALESVFRQSRPVDEVIVVDDGSSDGTAEAVKAEYGPRVRLIVRPNGGVSKARRTGIEAASNEWIAFLDSDDEWTLHRNEWLRDAADSAPADVAWLFGDTEICTDRASVRMFSSYGLRVDGGCVVYDDPMPTQFPLQFSLVQSSLIRRTALMAVDAFTHDLRSSEDLLAGWQVAARYRMGAIPGVVTIMHREEELAASSLDRAGKQSPDYHLARALGFDALARSGRPGEWVARHSEEVRRYCLRKAQRDKSVVGLRRFALRQFSHSFSSRSVLFAAAILMGMPGVRGWLWATDHYQRRSMAPPPPRDLFSHEDSSLQVTSRVHD
jgi:glycosyltransferase involved in cell wall biosynthesis